MRAWKKIGIAAALLLVAVVAAALAVIGPRNLIGMLRYDKRQEGRLRVGDRAPDVTLLALDGRSPERLSERVGRRPLVLVFGSYT